MKKPNIILILTDHFRPDSLGLNTPNLSALAAKGVRFENAYSTSPLCQPARNCIITGLYPSQTGICGNQTEPISDEMKADTFMNHLQATGYYTALIGKHHYIDRFGVGMNVCDDDAEVKKYGFDHVCQVVDDFENIHNDDEYTAYLKQEGKLEQFRAACETDSWSCKPHPFGEDDYVDGFIGCKGVEFVSDYTEDKPFYMNLSFVGPHPPYWHPGEFQYDPADMPAPIGSADSEETRKMRAHYMTKCSMIDRYVGRLIEALKKCGLYDDTVFIFSSDHGDNLGDFGIWDKRFYYENSVGVPFFIAGAGIQGQERLDGAHINKALVSHLDIYPTILSLAGIKSTSGREKPGRDILKVLRGERDSSHKAIFSELGTTVMIRTGNWKLVFDPEQGGVQYLFNLVVDPNELQNLAGVAGYERITADLIEQMLAHRILLTQSTHTKEQQRIQRVRII